MKCIGIDLSLTSTGISDGVTYADRIRPKTLTGFPRIRLIRETVRTYLHAADLAVIEGLAYNAFDAGSERAGLHWIIRERLDYWGIPTAVVTPAQLKLYATGIGNAHKDEVLAAVIRQWPVALDISNNDEADAAVLAAMGRDFLGCPSVLVPAVNRAALLKVAWPERDAA